MALLGQNIIILRGGTAIAGVKSNEIQSGADTIEISSPNSSQWKEYIAGRKEWSVNVNYLVAATSALDAASSLKDLLKVGETYTLLIKDRDASTSVTGNAILTTCRITATFGNIAQGSFQFRGTGALS